jgi:hypothetical protein
MPIELIPQPPVREMPGEELQAASAQIQLYYVAITLHVRQLRRRIYLARTYPIRTRKFWQDTVALLHALRREIQITSASLTSDAVAFLPVVFRDQLHLTDDQIDEAGIAVTAYVPICFSRQKEHLQYRQYALKVLEKLAHAVVLVQDLLVAGQQKYLEVDQFQQRQQEAQ